MDLNDTVRVRIHSAPLRHHSVLGCKRRAPTALTLVVVSMVFPADGIMIPCHSL